MATRWLKRTMPRGIYGRAALILILPMVVVQVAISIAFVQRHYEDVTTQMTRGVVLEVRALLSARARDGDTAMQALARNLQIAVAPGAAPPVDGDRRRALDLSGRRVVATLREALPGLLAVDLVTAPRRATLWVDDGDTILEIGLSRRRVSASNPHQFLVVAFAFSLAMTAIAFVYLRNQLRPITRLAAAADAFGRGQRLDYRPAGAVEVRSAGRAFLAMRDRIERQIAQRTLLLSGVSHDLRTPLTRLRLELSLLDNPAETEAMRQDIDEMERLIESFLDFARGATVEEPQPVVPADIVRAAVDKAVRAGGTVEIGRLDDPAEVPVPMRAVAVARALDNLVGNAVRYADRAWVSVEADGDVLSFVVEDDGPGIPAERRAEACDPFVRLDPARNQDMGSGAGLGLSIARDVAQAHGGALELAQSVAFGGLRAALRLPIR